MSFDTTLSQQDQANKPKGRISSRDVARMAGVSTATVSLVVRGSNLVKESTRERVQAVINQLGYQSHAAASALRSAHANTVGYLVPEIIEPVRDIFRHQILSALTTQAHSEGLHVLLDTLINAQTHAYLVNSGRIDGAIVDWMIDDALLTTLAERRVPCVLVGRDSGTIPISWVKADEYHGAYQLTQHLIELGHRQMLVLSGGDENINSIIHERIQGYRAALDRAGMQDCEAIMWGDWTFESGYQMAKEALTKTPRPTALLALNEGIAVGVLKAIREAGLQVPLDISVGTIEDSPLVEYVSPELTSVHIPMYEVGKHATEILVHLIMSEQPIPQQRILPTYLQVRASTGPASTGRNP
ncbi:LacI family DNA-binding transcriptional regulator [Tengunoibacter tsumagoiensis]|uniref:LacI family transcriptional regulator n=1 Tax=Tengunoibacter tsumagoiensis TaxID=2014871 RepID=A0A402A6X7_9CHLR|nr:LacI family DNA-binding transcriptional regulator [Tengunoibacter tsumagoiensis]GCE14884.1 LacI family transcriptional regulator [Tengunoibacter tsumagoiensis]